MAEIGKADDYGLRASDYALPDAASLQRLRSRGQGLARRLRDEGELCGARLCQGRPRRPHRAACASARISIPRSRCPTLRRCSNSIAIRSDPAAYLRSFQPDQPQFEALRQKLIELRGGKVEEEVKPDVVVIPDGPRAQIRHGARAGRAAAGSGSTCRPDSNENKFDEAVLEARAAVPGFERRRGPTASSARARGGCSIRGSSRRGRSASEARIRQILVNMERWRWLPHDLGAFYVTVNIPEFTLRVVEEGTPILTARVVVGKPENADARDLR